MNDALKILGMVLIIMISRFVLMIEYNEMAYLPYAYAIFNTDWLSNDWTLSYKLLYLFPFSYCAGFFVHLFGFLPIIFLGRILSYIFFSFALLKLLKSLKGDILWAYIGLMVFFVYFPKGMFAGEWIIGGLESKVFAYSFILLAIAAILDGKIGNSLLYSGIALTLHPLVGGYHFICLASIMLYRVFLREVALIAIVKKSYLFLIGGMIGLVGIVSHLFDGETQELSSYAWDILVQVRNPFHNLPKLYTQALMFPLIFSVFNVATLLLSRRKEIKDLSLYILSSAFLSGIGILIYLFGDQALLRYYFFRFSDTIQPFLSLLIASVMVSGYISNLAKRFPNSGRIGRITVAGALAIMLTFFLVKNESNLRSLFQPKSYDTDKINERSSVDFELLSWIKENTATNSVFIAPITMEAFYIYTERALFLNWKSTPAQVTGILEWYNRVLMLNKGGDLFVKNIDPRKEVISNYNKLTKGEVLDIKIEYPEVTHIILPSSSSLDFPILKRTKDHVLYEL